METVVNEVRESVMTSNSSVSDLSALTEELSATMQEMSDNAAFDQIPIQNLLRER